MLDPVQFPDLPSLSRPLIEGTDPNKLQFFRTDQQTRSGSSTSGKAVNPYNYYDPFLKLGNPGVETAYVQLSDDILEIVLIPQFMINGIQGSSNNREPGLYGSFYLPDDSQINSANDHNAKFLTSPNNFERYLVGAAIVTGTRNIEPYNFDSALIYDVPNLYFGDINDELYDFTYNEADLNALTEAVNEDLVAGVNQTYAEFFQYLDHAEQSVRLIDVRLAAEDGYFVGVEDGINDGSPTDFALYENRIELMRDSKNQDAFDPLSLMDSPSESVVLGMTMGQAKDGDYLDLTLYKDGSFAIGDTGNGGAFVGSPVLFGPGGAVGGDNVLLGPSQTLDGVVVPTYAAPNPFQLGRENYSGAVSAINDAALKSNPGISQQDQPVRNGLVASMDFAVFQPAAVETIQDMIQTQQDYFMSYAQSMSEFAATSMG